jgi:hypothetical protein
MHLEEFMAPCTTKPYRLLAIAFPTTSLRTEYGRTVAPIPPSLKPLAAGLAEGGHRLGHAVFFSYSN